MTRTWSDVVKDIKTEDGLETANLDKSGNESKAANSIEMLDSEEPYQLKDKGQGSKQANFEARGEGN